jgi:hypothetical protein
MRGGKCTNTQLETDSSRLDVVCSSGRRCWATRWLRTALPACPASLPRSGMEPDPFRHDKQIDRILWWTFGCFCQRDIEQDVRRTPV